MNLDQMLAALSNDPNADVDVGELALRLAADEYSHLDVDGYLSELDAMAKEVRPYLQGDLRTQVRGLRRYLFHELGFHGNKEDYYDPQNSYFNMVMDRRVGIPISLSIVAIAVGRRIGVRIEGVGLPGHFIVKASDPREEVLFDPFHAGRELSMPDCEDLVRQSTGESLTLNEDMIQAMEVASIAQRMLNNLKAIYLGRRDFKRGARIIERLHQLCPDDSSQRRDLGACYLHLQQPVQAIAHLSAYLEAEPTIADAEQVENLLKQARRQLAEWN